MNVIAPTKKKACPVASDMELIRRALHEQGTLIAALLTSVAQLTASVAQLTARVDELIVIGHT